jgi:alkylmercury lyase
MSNIEHDNGASLAGFLDGYRPGAGDADPVPVTVTYAVIGLTNFGERPVPSARLAEVLGRPVSEAEALARQWGWPGTRVEGGLITVKPERAKSAARRHIEIGARRLGVTGCGCDVLFYAPLVRPWLQVEDTCPATGTLIRLVFTPGRVEYVEPAGAVVAMMGPQECANGVDKATAGGDIEDVDADVCAQMPLFASAEAAQRWLADHPGGRVFPIRDAWDLSPFRDWRDRMSALLNLGR